MIRPAISPKPRLSRCKVCHCKFTKARSIQPVCESPECKHTYGLRAAEKEARKRIKQQKRIDAARKLELKPLYYWAKRAEKACNEYIRLRDAGDPCISCGTYDAPQWHAGHCYTVAARPDIRYHEDNIHLQCPKCNTWQGGMVGEYKRRVVSKIGQERLDALEYVNPAAKKTREYYQAVEAHYKAEIKQIKAREAV